MVVAPVVLSGVAATGAAMVGATVRVVDARGFEVGRSAQVGSDGRFSVQLALEARAPFVLEARIDGGEPQVSVLDRVVGTTATVNVTPITSLMAARLSPNGQPQGLVTRFEQAAASAPGAAPLPTSAEIQTSRADILRIIEPVRLALGDTTDPVTGSFSVGGVGHDKLLDNGAVIGNGAGSGLFSSDVLVFDRPVYEYTRAEVRNQTPELVVFTVRWTNQRTLATDSMVVHAREDARGQLKLLGNQYRYSMSVRPIVLKQTHVRADSRHMDHLRSGCNLLVPNTQQNGQPMFDRVEVMAPVGLERSATRDVFVLRPMIGFSNLRMVGKFLDSRSSQVVWLRADWVEPAAASTTATTSGRTVTHPIQLDGGGAVWISDPQGRGWSDERLERLSHKSAWTFRYFLNGNTGNAPDAVQSMTTISRAPSVREARQQPLAVFAPSSVEWLRSMSMDKAANLFWMNARPQTSSPVVTEPPAISLSWEVPAGAVIPMNVNGFGRTTSSYSIGWEQRTAFDRLVAVASTVRVSPMTCTTSNPTLRAVLCHDGGNADRYSLKTMFTDFELWGKDARQIEYSRSYPTFIPSTRRTTANPEIAWLNAAP